MKRNDILSMIQLRQSTIKDWLACPMMFRLKHIDKLTPTSRNSAALHGTALHKVIHKMHTDTFNLDLETAYLDALDEAEQESPVPITWKQDREKYLENAREILYGYYSREEKRDCEVILSETPFRVKIHGLLFTGTIDQVRRNPDGTLELLDLKSNQQQPTLAFLHNDWQLNLYLYALKFGELLINGIWTRLRLDPDFASWYFLRGHEIRKRTTGPDKLKGSEKMTNPVIRTMKGEAELKTFKIELKKLLNAMLRDWHFPNPNHCLLCDYGTACMARHQTVAPVLPADLKQLVHELETA